MCNDDSEGNHHANIVFLLAFTSLSAAYIVQNLFSLPFFAPSVRQVLLLLPPSNAAAGCVFGFLVCSVQPHSRGMCLRC